MYSIIKTSFAKKEDLPAETHGTRSRLNCYTKVNFNKQFIH